MTTIEIPALPELNALEEAEDRCHEATHYVELVRMPLAAIVKLAETSSDDIGVTITAEAAWRLTLFARDMRLTAAVIHESADKIEDAVDWIYRELNEEWNPQPPKVAKRALDG